MPVLGAATLELNADSARLEQDLGRAVSQAAAFGTAIGQVMGQAISAGINKLTTMVDKAIETGDELNKLSQKTGMTVGYLAELRVAAELAGVSIGTLKSGVRLLYENLSQAGRVDGKASTAIEAIGLDVEKLRALKPDDLFRTVAEQLAKYEEGANRSALQTAILGRAGAELTPLINELAKTTALARELGITMDKETAEASERFKDNLTAARLATEALGQRIAVVLLPTLEKLSEYLVDNAKNTERLDTAARVADTGLKLFATAANVVGTVFSIAGNAVGNLAAVLVKFVSMDYRGALETLGQSVVDTGTKIGESVAQIELTWEESAGRTQAAAQQTGTKLAAPAIEAVKKIKAARHEADAEFQAFLKIRAIEEEAGKATQDFYAKQGAQNEQRLEMMRKQSEETAAIVTQAIYNAQNGIAIAMDEDTSAFRAVKKEVKETDDFARQMGLTFSSAFEAAVIGGKNLSGVLQGLAKDILNIVLRKTVTEPLGNSIAGLFSGSGGGGSNWLGMAGSAISSFFGGGGGWGSAWSLGTSSAGSAASSLIPAGFSAPSFAVGTDYVPRDMMARIHEGEAIVPAAENRNGGGRSVNINFTVNSLEPRTAAQVIMQNADAIKGVMRAALAERGRKAGY